MVSLFLVQKMTGLSTDGQANKSNRVGDQSERDMREEEKGVHISSKQ